MCNLARPMLTCPLRNLERERVAVAKCIGYGDRIGLWLSAALRGRAQNVLPLRGNAGRGIARPGHIPPAVHLELNIALWRPLPRPPNRLISGIRDDLRSATGFAARPP